MKFNLLGFIGVRLYSENKRYIRYFRNEYDLMHREGDCDTTVSVHVVDTLPSFQKGDVAATEKFVKLFRFSYLIRGVSGDSPEIYFKSHYMDRLYINAVAVFLQTNLLEPIIYLKLLEKNILLMHAAGAELNGKAILFPAEGGTGKTTTVLKLLSSGFKLLGDDLVAVDVETGAAYGYPRPLHLFTYNINSLEGARVPLYIKLVIRTKDVIRYILQLLTRQKFLISTRVHASSLYQGEIFSREAKVAKIAFLVKDGEGCNVDFNSEEVIFEHAAAIASSADLNDCLFDHVVLDDQEQKKIKKKELGVIAKLLSTRGRMSYINSRRLGHDDWADYIDEIKKEFA